MKLTTPVLRPAELPTAPAAGHKLWFLVSHSSAGGAQEIWANLALEFQTRGYPTTLMALYPFRKDVRATSELMPWTYAIAHRPKSPAAAARLFGTLVATIRDEAPAVIFTAMPAANVLAPLAARAAGRGTRVVTSHHTPVQTYNRVLDALDTQTGRLKTVQNIVCVSHGVGQSLASKPGSYRAKYVMIANALPPNVEAQLAMLLAHRSENKTRSRRVVATGRLAPQKNTASLVRAAAHLPDAEVLIVGDGPDKEMLAALARDLGVADRVKFLGHCPRHETLDILASGDVFAQPSLFEGHSLALIEAAKLGLPLVVSNVPTQVEGITAKDGTICGLIVEPDDVEGLARAIRRLLNSEEDYQFWSAKARVLSAQHSFENLFASYERLIA